MERLFLTKVWGFDPEEWPIMGFGNQGALKKVLGEVKPGDWMILVGTKGPETKEEDRGRLLGRIQIDRSQVDTERLLKSVDYPFKPEHFDENNKFKWPYGCPMIKAERFVDKPLSLELFGHNFPEQSFIQYAPDIMTYDNYGKPMAEKIAALETEAAELLQIPYLEGALRVSKALESGRRLKGPPPSRVRSGSVTDDGPAVCYCLKLNGIDSKRAGPKEVYKIGWAIDAEDRCRTLNSGTVRAITGYYWELAMSYPFESHDHAFIFEQLIHDRLDMKGYRVDGEQEIFSATYGEILSTMNGAYASAEWAK
jgi:hypothetical protein